jgi:hypothetical protein
MYISEQNDGTTNGTTKFHPTIEHNNQSTCFVHPLAWARVHKGELQCFSFVIVLFPIRNSPCLKLIIVLIITSDIPSPSYSAASFLLPYVVYAKASSA